MQTIGDFRLQISDRGNGVYRLKEEVRVIFYKSKGPGGQRKNKKETAVKIQHIPSGITVVATEHRSQAKNKELAFKRLKEKLEELQREQKPRIPTKPPEYVRDEIVEEKKKIGVKKKLRTKVNYKEELKSIEDR